MQSESFLSCNIKVVFNVKHYMYNFGIPQYFYRTLLKSTMSLENLNYHLNLNCGYLTNNDKQFCLISKLSFKVQTLLLCWRFRYTLFLMAVLQFLDNNYQMLLWFFTLPFWKLYPQKVFLIKYFFFDKKMFAFKLLTQVPKPVV